MSDEGIQFSSSVQHPVITVTSTSTRFHPSSRSSLGTEHKSHQTVIEPSYNILPLPPVCLQPPTESADSKVLCNHCPLLGRKCSLLHSLVKIYTGGYVAFIIEPHKAESGGQESLGFYIVCWFLLLNLIQTRVTWEEETFIEGLPSLDCPVVKFVGGATPGGAALNCM